jgi:glucose/arabinose dehydrogenase
LIACLGALLAGCTTSPHVVPPANRKPIDRSIIECPAGFAIVNTVRGFTSPTAFCFDTTPGENYGTLLVAESGIGGHDPRIYAIRPDDTIRQFYPHGRPIPFLRTGFRILGPIGGMTVVNGKVLVSHRDGNGMGVITALGYDGSHSTVVADLPAQGDHGVTDLVLNPVNGRLYFGLGSATNSGVVGMDNWQIGWVNDRPRFCDLPLTMLKLFGYRFDTKNPKAGLFGGADIAVTAPFQPFNRSNQTRIQPAPNGRPTAAIYSCSPEGGDLRVEAHGIRLPRGLACDTFGTLFFTNNGMELRGTRPVKDDPDSLLKLNPQPGTWYGWPDHSTDLNPISDPRYQPPLELVLPFGYPELSNLIDTASSTPALESPTAYRNSLVFGVFPSQSGAAKLAFVPEVGPFREFRGHAIVALSGDRAPFATSGQRLIGPVGYKVMAIDVDASRRQSSEFVRNTGGAPASKLDAGDQGLERPADVKFGPDGALYILDFGHMVVENGKEKVAAGTGKIFKVIPAEWSATMPATRPATAPSR